MKKKPETAQRTDEALPYQSPVAITPDEACEKALAHAVVFARGYGKINQIAEAMSAMTGDNVSRQMVGHWLAEDPQKRKHPGFGYGLLLLLCVQRLKVGDQFAIKTVDGKAVSYDLSVLLTPKLKLSKKTVERIQRGIAKYKREKGGK